MEGAPSGPLARSQAWRSLLQPMGRAQRGPSGKVSGPFTTNEMRRPRGARGKVLFACFVFYISLYLCYLYYALHRTFDNTTGALLGSREGPWPLCPPLATPLLVCWNMRALGLSCHKYFFFQTHIHTLMCTKVVTSNFFGPQPYGPDLKVIIPYDNYQFLFMTLTWLDPAYKLQIK